MFKKVSRGPLKERRNIQLCATVLYSRWPTASFIHTRKFQLNFKVRSPSETTFARLATKLSVHYPNATRKQSNVFTDLPRTYPQRTNPFHIQINLQITFQSSCRSFPSCFLILSRAFLIAVMYVTRTAQLILLHFITPVKGRCQADFSFNNILLHSRTPLYHSLSLYYSLLSPNILLEQRSKKVCWTGVAGLAE